LGGSPTEPPQDPQGIPCNGHPPGQPVGSNNPWPVIPGTTAQEIWDKQWPHQSTKQPSNCPPKWPSRRVGRYSRECSKSCPAPRPSSKSCSARWTSPMAPGEWSSIPVKNGISVMWWPTSQDPPSKSLSHPRFRWPRRGRASSSG
jgi:hypothetical protein